MGKLLEELKRFIATATSEELERAWKEVEQFKDVGPSVKDFCKQYEKVGKSEWFKKVYNGKSIGEAIECVVLSDAEKCYMMGYEDAIEDIEDTKDEAMRDIAWKIHVMISEGKSISEIDHYVCGICDF